MEELTGTTKESPVSQQLKLIDDRLGELSKTGDHLGGRLGNILSAVPPTEATETTKPLYESELAERLGYIRTKIETEISRLQNLTNRLTI